MVIWYISKYASPQKYFFGTRHFYLGEEWVKSGHEVSVITSNSSHLSKALPVFKKKAFSENINGINTFWLNTFKSKNASGLSRIISWIHFEYQLITFNKKALKQPDVIIASSLSLLTILSAWFLSKKYKAKLVFEVRDIWPLSIIILGNYSKSNLFIRFLSWTEKFGYEKSDLIVGTMPNLKEHVLNVSDKAARCITIPQGVNTAFYEMDQQLLSDEYKRAWLTGEKFRICYAGTINTNNPLYGLLAAARILKENDNIQFYILGEGNKKEELIRIAADLPNVIFPPAIKKNQVADFLSYMSICYDSFESELATYGLSRNKWIDYMYAAKPVICSFSGYKSMINEANCGEFVPFGDNDKLVQVICHYSNLSAGEIATIGNAGKQFLLNNRQFKTLAAYYISQIVEI